MIRNTKAPYRNDGACCKGLPERGPELAGSVSDPAATPLNKRITHQVMIGKHRFTVEIDDTGFDSAITDCFRRWS